MRPPIPPITDRTLVRLVCLDTDTEDWRGTLAEFEAANADAFGDEERAECRALLADTGMCPFGGGAAPLCMLEVVPRRLSDCTPQFDMPGVLQHNAALRLIARVCVISDPPRDLQHIRLTTRIVNGIYRSAQAAA